MHAERVIVETDENGNLKRAPRLQPNRRFEAIFLDLEQDKEARNVRTPVRELVGSVTFIGDVMDSVPEEGWDLPASNSTLSHLKSLRRPFL
jgi:hypothetical protein